MPESSGRIEDARPSRFRRYPEYRDSGVEWLGAIPAHWEVYRLRSVVATNITKSEARGIEPETEVSFIPMEALREYGGIDLDATRPFSAANGYTYFRDGDVVIAKITPCFENGKGALASGLSHGVGLGTTELHVLRPSSRVDARFLLYTTLSDHFRRTGTASMYGAGGQKRVPIDFVLDFRHPVPGLPEQRAIAGFLDRETAKITSLVEKKERLVALLHEKRAALITRAVTRGLDPNAPLKDSGIEWLGEIPAHWSVRRLKTMASVQLSNVDKKSEDGQVPVSLCNYLEVYYNDSITAELEFMKATATPEQVRRFSLREGDVLITKDSESWNDIAVPAVVSEGIKDVLCGYHLAHIRPQAGLDGRFLARQFSAIGMRDQFYIAANGITRFGLGGDPIRAGIFPVAPIGEQRAIVAFLDQETAKIDALVARVRQAIEYLNEFRTALISAAVTGRIDVREEAA